MKFHRRLLNETSKVWRQIDPFSLRVRLTVGIAAVAAVGLGSVAIWTSWKMQQILIATHIQNIEYIAERFPHDVEIYSEVVPTETALQKAIDTLTPANTLLWVRRQDGTLASQSAGLQVDVDSPNAALLSVTKMPIQPQVYMVNRRYWVLCSTVLIVNNKKLGQMYIARDVTSDQSTFMKMIQSIAIASALSILAIIIAIALYVQRSLKPLRQLSKLAGSMSSDDLGEAQRKLENAPSEIKELAQMWSIILSRLSQAWEQERQFVSNVSHELRTPLTIVHGYLQSTLRRANNLTEPQREALEIASSEAERTIRLLQDLLDLARADSGHLRFHLEPLMLNDMVTEVGGMAKQFSQREIAIEVVKTPIEVKADPNRLKQVLLNLIDNALKYSEPNTTVTLKVDYEDEQAMIQVCDKGCGIPLQHQNRIFERFYRVDEARSRSTGGCGLGLSIVKTLVEGMGGTVTVRSQLGEGTTFIVALPTQSAVRVSI